MENKSRKKTKKKTVIKPPKNNRNTQLSRDEVRSINKKKMSRRRKLKKNMLSILLLRYNRKESRELDKDQKEEKNSK